MDSDVEYLLSFLQDEFQSYRGVQVRPLPRTGVVRSPDLVQDYDPETRDLHVRRGVVVRTQSREYFFPAEWVANRQFSEVQKLAAQIRDQLDWS